MNLKEYREILCGEFPDFLNKYLSLKILTRLKGIGLLCGTDWTPLFKNRFYYSRFDHSVNCALVAWKWTHKKRETVAALLHDVSTPAFSHVIDFKNGDALTQESTEDKNAAMIHADADLAAALEQDGLCASDVDDYHRFSICDNEVPRLSADRLEYMFPSGAALDGTFSIKDIRRIYGDLTVCKNEDGLDEFAFVHEKTALLYFKKFLHIGYLLQKNEDKMAMQLLAQVVRLALDSGALKEDELYSLSEREIIGRWDKMLFDFEAGNSACAENAADSCNAAGGGHCPQKEARVLFLRHYKTFRGMKKIKRSYVPEPDSFNVRLDVKRRYINPLVRTGFSKAARLNDVSGSSQPAASLQAARLCSINKIAQKMRSEFLDYSDFPYAVIPLAKLRSNLI